MKIKQVLPVSLASALIVTSWNPCRREPPHPEQYRQLPYAATLTDEIVSTNSTATAGSATQRRRGSSSEEPHYVGRTRVRSPL